MIMAAPDKKGATKGRKNRKVVKTNVMYDEGKLKKKTCPKCGAGVFMAEHKNRISCGKCGYTEFKKSP
jgi:ubiquitin-small subunit ribosomal protein S27Ae